MVYDNTVEPRVNLLGQPGFAIHYSGEENMYELYTDDGMGNGDFICSSPSIYWIRTIAESLNYRYIMEGHIKS